MIFFRLLKISRPKFWHYVAGPFLLGSIFIVEQNPILIFPALAGFFWFLFFGNLFVYGINDLYDQDTDVFNEKKNEVDEVLLQDKEQKMLKISLVVSVLSGGFFLFISWFSAVNWLLFMFFSWQYSGTPIRAKSKPFLDGIFNVLYILPAGVALGLGSQTLPISLFIAGTLWCMAMHAFSAIPDIVPDKKAGLQTTATFLGWRNTLLYCLGCYLIIFYVLPGVFLKLLLLPYLVIVGILYFKNADSVRKFYPYFPWLNLLVGAGLFFYIVSIVSGF